MPDFQFKNIDSVKKCIQAAGWKYTKTSWTRTPIGDGTVMNQFPGRAPTVDPKKSADHRADVSTGRNA